MPQRILQILAIAAFWGGASAAGAATFYVATTGSESNAGTADSPWPSINYAFEKIGGGHTIIVKPGIYSGPIIIPHTASGLPGRFTVVKSEEKWKAIILGSPQIGLSTANGCNRVVIDGFEVAGSRSDGIKVSGNYNIVRNCYVHNNSRQGISSSKRTGTIVERNLVEYNGQAPQFHHGVYVSGSKITIRSNIIRHNSGAGLNTNGGIVASLIAHNLIHNHRGDTMGVVIFAPRGGFKNTIVHNTIVNNNGGIRFYGGNSEIVANNILMSAGGKIYPLEVNGRGAKIQADYNLCTPPSPYDGPHTLTGDPKFVNSGQGTYWLQSDSPAIQKGTTAYAQSKDFWGRAASTTAAPTLGCFAFSQYLTTEAARASWYQQWPYRYAEGEGMDVPDFWIVPTD